MSVDISHIVPVLAVMMFCTKVQRTATHCITHSGPIHHNGSKCDEEEQGKESSRYETRTPEGRREEEEDYLTYCKPTRTHKAGQA